MWSRLKSQPLLSHLYRSLYTSISKDVAFRAPEAQTSIPLRTGRPRLLVLGSGWGSARLLHDIDPVKYDISVISPRNHFVFTPLLSSTCVGTLEPRAVTLAVTDIQKALKAPQNFYYCAEALAVNPEDKVVEAQSLDGLKFFVEYDVLAIATGSQGSTFGIPGVNKHANFLRDASNAEHIRSKLIYNWSSANIPTRSIAERERLLHTVIVGGGPTGVEFAGELADFVNRDLVRIDPYRGRDMRITLIEASELLGSFDAKLREYAAGKLIREGVHLLKAVVKEVREHEIELQNGQIIPYGLCVWSTGVGPTPFTLSLPFIKTPKGRISIDDHLRVFLPQKRTAGDSAPGPGPKAMNDVSIVEDEEEPVDKFDQAVALDNVFALGDCCANAETPLPALAQVAEQQGKYLARLLNARAEIEPGPENESSSSNSKKFIYRSLGSMATVGGRSAVIELQRRKGRKWSWAGFSSFLAWRSAYLTRLGSLKARLYVAGNWTMTLLFGRDISRW